jgi:hypothetical protein
MYASEETQEGMGESSQQDTSTTKSPLITSTPSVEDFTLIPKILDAKLETSDGALKSTTVNAGTSWVRTRQENLLLPPIQEYLSDSKQHETEKNRAMDLLTALSRSGSLPIESSEIHVVVALTHCFEQDVMNTVYRDNINPITKVESSLLLLGSTIHNVPEETLLAIPASSGAEEISDE